MKNLGLDLGRTIVGQRGGDRTYVEPKAFEIIKKLTKEFDNTYIISRVNEEQRERSLNWLKEVNFFEETGIDKENLYYCWERKDKSIFVRALEITHFIDDRAHVLFYLDEAVNKYLFNPEPFELAKYQDSLKNTTVVQNWTEIEKLLTEDKN